MGSPIAGSIDRRFNDGNKPSGSEKVVLQDGTVAVAEDLNTDEPTSADDVQDELGQPDGGIYTPEKVTGSATLQLPSFATDIPRALTLFVFPFRNFNKLFVITKVGQPRKQKGIRKFPLEFAEVIHPEAFTLPAVVPPPPA